MINDTTQIIMIFSRILQSALLLLTSTVVTTAQVEVGGGLRASPMEGSGLRASPMKGSGLRASPMKGSAKGDSKATLIEEARKNPGNKGRHGRPCWPHCEEGVEVKVARKNPGNKGRPCSWPHCKEGVEVKVF